MIYAIKRIFNKQICLIVTVCKIFKRWTCFVFSTFIINAIILNIKYLSQEYEKIFLEGILFLILIFNNYFYFLHQIIFSNFFNSFFHFYYFLTFFIDISPLFMLFFKSFTLLIYILFALPLVRNLLSSLFSINLYSISSYIANLLLISSE